MQNNRIKADEFLSSNPNCNCLLDISQIPFACSCLQILFDDQGKPEDFVVLELNSALERLLNVKRANILGQRIGVIHSHAPQADETELINFVTSSLKSVALSDQPLRFRQHSPLRSIWLEITAYKRCADHIIAFIMDISASMKHYSDLDIFFDISPDLLTISDAAGNFTKINRAAEKILGFRPDEIEGRNFFDLMHPDDIGETHKAHNQVQNQKSIMNFVNRYQHKDGSYRYLEWDSQKQGDLVYSVCRDVTETRKFSEVLKKSEARYRLITENTSDVIWVMNLTQDKLTYVSPSILQLLGYTPEEILSQPFEAFLTPGSATHFKNQLSRIRQELESHPDEAVSQYDEVQNICKSKDVIWVGFSIKCQYNSEHEIEAVGVSRNIDAQKQAEAQIRYLSYHDYLTGLYNRRFFEEEIRRLNTERNLPISLISTDLNQLKQINDTFGHEKGDELIIKAAKVMEQTCRPDDIIARVGGDEFAIFLPKTSQVDAEKIVERIRLNCLKQQVNSIDLSISIGVATKDSLSDPLENLMRVAEKNMYIEKRTKNQLH